MKNYWTKCPHLDILEAGVMGRRWWNCETELWGRASGYGLGVSASATMLDKSEHVILSAGRDSDRLLEPFRAKSLGPQVFTRWAKRGAHILIASDLGSIGDVVAILHDIDFPCACGVVVRAPMPKFDINTVVEYLNACFDRLGPSKPRVYAVVQDDVFLRIAAAWSYGNESDLIATAAIIDGDLLVIGCDLNRFVVPFRRIPELAEATRDDLAHFELDPDGSWIYWPKLELHADLEYIRSLSVPSYIRQAEARSREFDLHIGEAIRCIRRRLKLTQTELAKKAGLSLRHLRRLEKGQSHARISTLERLAKAQGMDEDDYLGELHGLADKVTP